MGDLTPVFPRNFGFLHANSKQLIPLLQLRFRLDPHRALASTPMLCSCCGAVMKILKTRIPPVFPATVMVPT